MKVKKDWLLLISVHYATSACLAFLYAISGDNGWWIGFLFLLALIPIAFKTIAENRLFSPISAILIFDISFALYLMMLVNTYEAMSVDKMQLIVACSFIWKLVTVSSRGFTSKQKIYMIETAMINSSTFMLMITMLFVISAGAMLFEWQMAGGVPALRSDSETFRFTVSYSSITHLLAIMNKIVAALIGAYFVNKGSISFHKDFFLLFEMIIAEVLMIGTAMRGEAILAPCVVFMVYAIKHKLPTKVYIIGGVFALAFVGIIPYFRMFRSYGATYVLSLQRISKYPQLFALTPLYQTFTNNFNILNLDFSIFPKLRNFGYGIYSILPEIPFADLGSNLMSVQNEVLNNNFYSGLTATFLASWYADFGIWGCLAISFIYAKITNIAYSKYLREHDLSSLVLYAYVFYSSLWIFYNGVFNFVFLCYSGIIWLVLKIRIHR